MVVGAGVRGMSRSEGTNILNTCIIFHFFLLFFYIFLLIKHLYAVLLYVRACVRYISVCLCVCVNGFVYVHVLRACA